MATISFTGDLILDQSTGIQDDDADLVRTVVNAGIDDLSNGPAADGGRQIAGNFLTYLNTDANFATNAMSDAGMQFAARVGGASQAGIVTTTHTATETISRLFFSDANGNDLFGQDSGLQTLDGSHVYLYSAPGQGGHIVLATDSAPVGGAMAGHIVAAFYLDAAADNSTAGIQAVTFMALKHPLGGANNPDDRVDFSNLLKISAVVTNTTPIGVDDDGPTVTITTVTEPLATVDETTLTTDGTADFSGNFSVDYGTDGPAATTPTVYSLGTPGGDSGLIDTATNQHVILSKNLATGDIEGKTETSNVLVFKVSVNTATGVVTLDQQRAIVHANPNDPDEGRTLASDGLVTLTATATDADTDTAANTIGIGQNLIFKDDGPAAPNLTLNAAVAEDESAGLNTAATTADPNAADDVAPAAIPAAIVSQFNGIPGTALGYAKGSAALVSLDNPANAFGADGPAAAPAVSVSYALSASSPGVSSGLSTSDTNTQIYLYNGTGTQAGLVLGRIGTEGGANPDTANPNGQVAFALAVDGNGVGYIAEFVAIKHDPAGGSTPAAYDDVVSLANSAVTLTATRTDGDGDHATSTPFNVGSEFRFQDDGPTAGTPQHLVLNNADNPITGTAAFAYDLGADGHAVASYTAGATDFADLDPNTAGNQPVTLTGTVGDSATPNLLSSSVTPVSESATQAKFTFDFTYDKDPITQGNQIGHTTGTLTLDKVADTYKVDLDGPIQGFSFDVFHTSDVQHKNPTGNTGHPNIVVEQLTPDNDAHPLFVQFTADTGTMWFSPNGDTPNPTTDKTFTGTAHDMVTGTETWASATQSTNGVAGDTIQKGENLTLRFFDHNIFSDVDNGIEQVTPSQSVAGVAIKFDGIGASEDLIVVLDLKDSVTGASITRAIVVDNGDIYKASTPGGVPAPYNTEFSLDNNDGLVIIENNDYNNTAAGEHYQIQGLQIMQSANGLTGSGINLTKAVGDLGGSPVTGTLQPFGGNVNDVLKITDIGFIQTSSGNLDARLHFGLQIKDADNDTAAQTTLDVDVLNPSTIAGLNPAMTSGWVFA